jgi:hypothetical protein
MGQHSTSFRRLLPVRHAALALIVGGLAGAMVAAQL